MKNRKKRHVELRAEDYVYLRELLSKGELSAKKLRRALALLELNKGKTHIEVMKIVPVSNPTLISWVKKYKESGLAFLEDQARSGRPRGIGVADRAKITALACSEPPEGYSRWSLRLLADRLVELAIVDEISHMQVGRILKKMNYSLTAKNNGVSDS